MYGSLVNYAPARYYQFDENGDVARLTYEQDTAEIERYRSSQPISVPEPLSPEAEATLPFDQQLAHYFNDIDRTAIDEIRAMAAADGTQIVLVSGGQASSFLNGPHVSERYQRSSTQQLSRLAEALGARHMTVTAGFSAPWFAIADPVHFNRDGGRAFAELAGHNLLGQPDASSLVEPFAGWQAPRGTGRAGRCRAWNGPFRGAPAVTRTRTDVAASVRFRVRHRAVARPWRASGSACGCRMTVTSGSERRASPTIRPRPSSASSRSVPAQVYLVQLVYPTQPATSGRRAEATMAPVPLPLIDYVWTQQASPESDTRQR